MKAVDQDGGEWGRKTIVGSSLSEGSQVCVCGVGGGLYSCPCQKQFKTNEIWSFLSGEVILLAVTRRLSQGLLSAATQAFFFSAASR